MKRILCVVLAAACGGSSKKPEPMPQMEEPAWAAHYERRAAEGCECADAACLDEVHVELAAMETKHGGIDEAPPTVHVAHGKFDQCWRDGTRDIGRDLSHSAQKVCTCATADCLRLAKIELAGLVDGKYRENLQADLQASPTALASMQRASDCIAKVTMPAAEAIAIFDRLTSSMCACKDFDCVTGVAKQRETAWGKYIDIDAAIDQNRVNEFASQYCDCMRRAATDAIRGMSPVPSLTRVDVSLNCN